VLSVPPKILYPIVLGLAFVGTYAISYSVIDFYLLIIFGVVGYFLSAAKVPATPLILAVIIGNDMEQSFRQAFVISNGSLKIFFASPLCIVLFALTIISIVGPVLRDFIVKRKNIAAKT
jgi:putative tricarboxylic transport membrane protein